MTEETHVGARIPLPWNRYDTIAIGTTLVVAIVFHFWRLQIPDLLVYDEHIYVEEAYKYLGGEAFFEVHPPLAITLIATCAWLFGCHSWSWRIPSAIAGTALIPITYLLARRIFNSRRAAFLAVLLVLCEGMFLEYSRLALINIIYVTLGAASYLALFRFMQVEDAIDRRRSMTWLGVLLGLGLGAKLAIPAVAWLLTILFLVYTLLPISFDRGTNAAKRTPLDSRYLVGALALVGGLSGLFFLLTFLPNYLIGWWVGISSITSYYHHVLLVNQTYPNPPSHQDSPWWSWPLLLRAYRYAQKQDDLGMYLVVWGGGNPAIWWASSVAIILGGIRALRREGMAWSFLIIGYLMYTAFWIPVHRALYIYSYMPAFYLAILALAGLLDACWTGTARIWEESALLLPVFAVALLGLGYLNGAILSAVVLAGFVALLPRGNWSGRFVFAIVVAASIVVFFYFLPVWFPFPLSENGVEARMWFNNAGIGDWK